MSTSEFVKHKLIGTRLEHPLRGLRNVVAVFRKATPPEIADAIQEDRFLHQIIGQSVKDGMNCVDVGGHLGAVTHLFVTHSPGGRHVCVEASAYKARWIRKKYPMVEVVEAAMSDHEGTVSFFHQPRNSGYSGLGLQKAGVNSTQNTVEVKVKCQTLDATVPVDRKIHLLKIDVEGAELLVLRGGTRVLETSRPLIIFECTTSGTAALGVDPRDLHALLHNRFGYRIFTPRGYLEGHAPLDSQGLVQAMQYPFKAFSFVAAQGA